MMIVAITSIHWLLQLFITDSDEFMNTCNFDSCCNCTTSVKKEQDCCLDAGKDKPNHHKYGK